MVDPNVETLDFVKKKYPSVHTFSILNDTFLEKFDGYIVATPPKTHFEIAKKIIHKKISLLVEKPITLNTLMLLS